jgi:hypothetical protein
MEPSPKRDSGFIKTIFAMMWIGRDGTRALRYIRTLAPQQEAPPADHSIADGKCPATRKPAVEIYVS